MCLVTNTKYFVSYHLLLSSSNTEEKRSEFLEFMEASELDYQPEKISISILSDLLSGNGTRANLKNTDLLYCKLK